MSKIYLSVRDEKGRMHSIDPANIPADCGAEVRAAAEALALAMLPKRGRGRPKGYKCSADTVNRMVSGRLATLARKRGFSPVSIEEALPN